MIHCIRFWSILALQWNLATCFLTLPHRELHETTSWKTTTSLQGVLSRSAILKSVNRKNSSGRGNKPNASLPPQLSKALLMEAMDEALFRQDLIRQALEMELEKTKVKKENSADNQNQSITSRQEEISGTTEKLLELKQRLAETKNCKDDDDLESFKLSFASLGFESVLRQSPDCWRIRRQDGRPRGFDGLVFYTPKGVPILVGRPKAHKDETLRRISQGADLWFQVEDYSGSRVLLRTSLKRGLRGSKECMQIAADLAARFSDCYYDRHATNYDDVVSNKIPVMYCDSKNVAKRGSKVGQMRQGKSIGRLFGDPRNVEEMTRGKSL
jgi:hypothetical protein